MRLVIYYISYLVRLVVNLYYKRNDDFISVDHTMEIRKNAREI